MPTALSGEEVYAIIRGCRRRLSLYLDTPDIDDACHDAWIKAMRGLPKLRTPIAARAYIWTIMVRAAFRILRAPTCGDCPDVPDSALNPEQAAILGEQQRRVAALINALPRKYQDAVARRPGTTAVQRSRAYQRLRTLNRRTSIFKPPGVVIWPPSP